MELLRFFEKISKKDAAIAGGKGASLGEMTRAGIPVPPGFVILADAFERFIEETDLVSEIDAILHKVHHEEIQSVDNASENIQRMIIEAKMPEDIEKEIMASFKKLGAKFVAVRSSATAEDSASAAWAGQLDTYLNTTEENVLEKVKHCWASLFTPRAIFYRFEKDLHRTKISVAVVIQKMVESEVSGIAFSVHPVTQDYNQLIIEAGLGLGEAIVSGQITPDSYVVEKSPRRIIDKNISAQEKGLFKKPAGGNEWKDIPAAEGEKQKLSDKQIEELSELVLKIEKHYGFPCDIEWAYERETFYITQSRPITTLFNKSNELKANALTTNSDDEWMLAEKVPDCDVYFFQVPLSAFTNDSSFSFIPNYTEALSVYNGFEMDFYFRKKDSFIIAESIVEALIRRPAFGNTVNKGIVTWSKKLIASGNKIAAMDLSKASNATLSTLYEKNDGIHTKLYTYGWLPVSVDMFHNNFTDALKKYLISVTKSAEEAETAFRILVTPSKKTILASEREQFLTIYSRHSNTIKKYSSLDETKSLALKKALVLHRKKWGHLGYIYAGNAEIFSADHYFQEMIDLEKSGIKAKDLLLKERKQLAEAEIEKRRLAKKLKINPVYKRLFNTAIDFSLTKLIRRDAQLRNIHTLHITLLEEIAKRLRITRQEVQYMLKGEIRDALVLDKKIDRDVLEQRLKKCVLHTKKGFEKIYIKEEVEEMIKDIHHKVDTDIKEFRGQPAEPGYAKGIVKIIIRSKDMIKMNKGDILVSIATDPDIVSAMKKAAAIITEQGGITSHAAIVSRELGIPCIIGTKIATKVLNDGDEVEVDADRGLVRIIKKD